MLGSVLDTKLCSFSGPRLLRLHVGLMDADYFYNPGEGNLSHVGLRLIACVCRTCGLAAPSASLSHFIQSIGNDPPSGSPACLVSRRQSFPVTVVPTGQGLSPANLCSHIAPAKDSALKSPNWLHFKRNAEGRRGPQ